MFHNHKKAIIEVSVVGQSQRKAVSGVSTTGHADFDNSFLDTLMYARIPYEGLDSQGSPVLREATVIGELPSPELRAQCADAAAVLGKRFGLRVVRSLPFGAPVYEAFAMRRPDAKQHPESKLLLKLGCDVSLECCG